MLSRPGRSGKRTLETKVMMPARAMARPIRIGRLDLHRSIPRVRERLMITCEGAVLFHEAFHGRSG